MLGVEKPAAEEPSGHRFLTWVVRHPSWTYGRNLQPVVKTGVIQNIGDLGKLRGGMLCKAGYVHGNISH